MTAPSRGAPGANTGKIDNCQIRVFLAYARRHGHTLLDTQLYLPEEEGAQDAAQREAAGVPPEVVFRTKPQLAAELVLGPGQAIRHSWVTFDEGYGKAPGFLGRLEEAGERYVGEVPKSTRVWLQRPVVEEPGRGSTWFSHDVCLGVYTKWMRCALSARNARLLDSRDRTSLADVPDEIEAGVTAMANDLTITGGMADRGGGILNDGGSLTLERVVVANNRAVGAPAVGPDGGGVANQSGATLVIADSTFTDNRAMGTVTNAVSRAGVIYNSASTLAISGSTFTGNQALGASGHGGSGGALLNRDAGAVVLTDSAFHNNLARAGNGGNANGGAIFNITDSVMTVSRSTFTANRAVGGNGGQGNAGAARGGAIINSGSLEIADSTFAGNAALGGNGNVGTFVGLGVGGALENLPGGIMAVDASTFTGNRAVGGNVDSVA